MAAVDLAQLSREDMIVGALSAFLIIDLLFLPWHDYIVLTTSATSAPSAAWGVLALLADIALLSDLALDRFGTSQLPAIRGSQAATRAALAATTLFFMAIKFLADTTNLGAGCWLGLIAVVALFVFCARDAAASAR